MKLRRSQWIALTAAVLAVLSCGGVGVVVLYSVMTSAISRGLSTGGAGESVAPDVTPDQQAWITGLTGLRFPASTQYLYFKLEGFQDRHLLAKVAMPRADLPTLLESPHLKGADFHAKPLPFATNDHFRPDLGAAGRAATIMVQSVHQLRVLIDDGDTATVTVFIEYSES